jgi:N-acetyl-gamma-glutamyl-phosphate reductase
MIHTAIIGGAGYTGGELIRLLLRHPKVKLTSVHSRSQAGKKLSEVLPDLLGETELRFSPLSGMPQAEVIFLALPHGESGIFLGERGIPEGSQVIDLSRDFRLKGPHKFVYGLPELNRAEIKKTRFLANPGCFATAIQLGLLPLAKAGALGNEVHIHAVTGSTGAGQKPGATTHFSWRNNNLSLYKAFNHQHLGEIRQSLQQLQPDFQQALNFLPMRGNFARGIYASLYLSTDLSLEEAQKLYVDHYASHPFVHLSPTLPDLKPVVNTNKCILHLSKHEDKLLIVSTLDNLLKGASGQAIQNLNLMQGWDEQLGLSLKSSVY